MKNHYVISSAVVLLLGMLPMRASATEVVAKYTFDGREPEGEVVKRPLQDVAPFDGEDYVPDANHGEIGPRLLNPSGSGTDAHYRSYYNNSASEGAEGREVLEMRLVHPGHFDIFRTAEGEGPLPTDGSFTWEIICRVDAFDGTNHYGILIDASKGAGRIVGMPGEDADKSLTTRLWMKRVPENEEMYLLCFSVPVDDRNRCTTVSTELKFGNWYHIAAVYNEDSQSASLFIDGQEAAENEATSAPDRSSGFSIGGYGPEVFRIDHIMRLEHAFIDAIAFSRGAVEPGQWALSKEMEKQEPLSPSVTQPDHQ